MTDDVTPDPKTIDFFKVFAGIEYPKDTVKVITSEKLAYAAHKIASALKIAQARLDDTDEIKGLEASYEEVLKAAKEHTYVFHLTGVSREVRTDLTKAINAEFEVETDVFGRMVPNAEADKAYRERRWALQTEKIQGPDGAVVVAPTPENLAAFIDNAPDPAILAVEAKIAELTGDGVQDGFDSIIRDADFLSQP